MDFRRLFDAAPSAYMVMTPDLVIVEANAAYLASVGRSREEILGRYVFDAFPPAADALNDDGVPFVRLSFEQALSTARTDTMPIQKYDILDSTSGQDVERYWSLASVPVLDDEGVAVLVMQRVEDVTDLVLERNRGTGDATSADEGEWRHRFDEVQADLLAHARELTATQSAKDLAARQVASLAAVAIALTSANTVEEFEQVIALRGLEVLGADGGAVISPATDGGWRTVTGPALGEQVQTIYGELPYDSTLPACWTARHGERLLLPDRASGLAFSPAMAKVYSDTGRLGWAFLPLTVDGERLGALAVCWVEEHVCPPYELDLLEGFAAQCSQALHRIRAAEAQRAATVELAQLAESLQQALLTPPPEPDRLHIVVRYRPAADHAQVGGDWYDAFLQPDGATMLVIGDVVGHDRVAAAHMGQIRGLLRALAYDADAPGRADTPAAILTHLEHTARGLAVDTLATVVLGRIEQLGEHTDNGCRMLRWSNAGHPPPVLLLPDGSSTFLAGKPDLLLGVDPDSPRADHTAELPDGATLLLYSDGLVERRDASVDDGMDQLQHALTDLADRPIDELCDTLLDRLAQRGHEDDIALLAVRINPEG